MNTIARQILVSLLLTVLAVLGGWGWLEVQSANRVEREHLHEVQIQTAERLANSLVYSLWNLNQAEVEETVDIEAMDGDEQAILVLDDSDSLYAARVRDAATGRIRAYNAEDPGDKSLLPPTEGAITRDIVNKGKPIGRVCVYANETRLLASIRRLKVRIATELLVLVVALLFVQFLVLRGVIIRPLTMLTAWASSSGPDRLSPPPPTLAHSKEIGMLASAFSQMTNRLASDLLEIGDKNRRLLAGEEELRLRNAELVLAEETLRHKNAILEAQTNSTIDGILIVDSQRKKILQNQRSVRMWKIPQSVADNEDDQVQVQHATCMTKDPERFAEKVAHLYSHPDEICRDEVELTDGTILDRYSAPVVGKDGQHYGRIWMFRDITEAKRTEKAVRDSEARFRNLIEHAPVAISIGREGITLYVNRKYLEQYGFRTLDEVAGRPILDAWAPEFRDIISERMRLRALGLPVPAEYEGVGQRKDGTQFPVHTVVQSVDLPDGPASMAFLTDVTERNRAAAEIQRLQNYLSNIINSMPSILVGLDRSGTVTQWNRQAEIDTGLPSKDAVGQPFTSVLADFTPWVSALREEVERNRSASTGTVPLIKDGERHIYSLMLYPLVANCIEGAVVRIEDVTERTRIQEIMVQTEKMMSVGGLAAGMAHEINNPLGIIAQAAQNVERRLGADLPANRQAAEEVGITLKAVSSYLERRSIPVFIKDILDASSRAAGIVNNMLTFSRKSKGIRQPTELPPLVDRALALAAGEYDLKKRFDFRGIDILRDFDPKLPPVPVEAVEIEQVLLNLFKNAAHAMADNPPERKPRLVVRLKREERYARIEVQDNGPGMTQAVCRRIFEPFFTTKSPGLGTGLGLSVSYVIVTQNHGGVIGVESSPGNGALFSVRLPLERDT